MVWDLEDLLYFKFRLRKGRTPQGKYLMSGGDSDLDFFPSVLELNVDERWIELGRELRDPGDPSLIDIPISRKEVRHQFCVTLLPDRAMFAVRFDASDLPPWTC